MANSPKSKSRSTKSSAAAKDSGDQVESTSETTEETEETMAAAARKAVEAEAGTNEGEEVAVVELPSEAEIESLIKTFVIGSMAVALVPVPAFDAAAIVALQVKMVHSLTNLYGVSFNDKLAQRLIVSLIGGVAPVALGLSAASLAKSIPFVGTLGGTAGMVLLAGAATYASGKVLSAHLDRGGDLTDVEMSALRAGFREQFHKGKEVAKASLSRAKDLVASGKKGSDVEVDTGAAQPA